MTTTPAVDFASAGDARQILAGLRDPHDDVGPDVHRLGLDILVAYGFLTAPQARALWGALVENSAVTLPPQPGPDDADLVFPLYAVLRAALALHADSVDSWIGDAASAIWEAISDFIDSLTGPTVSDLLDVVTDALS